MNPRMCFVSSYPPRECGIATFARDLRQAIGQLRSDAKTSVIAVTNTPDGYGYPPEVVFEIRLSTRTHVKACDDYIALTSEHTASTAQANTYI